jgi:hypothetical protein
LVLIVVVIIIVVGVDHMVIVLTGLHFASIAFFAEGKIEIVALNAHPILAALLTNCPSGFLLLMYR